MSYVHELFHSMIPEHRLTNLIMVDNWLVDNGLSEHHTLLNNLMSESNDIHISTLSDRLDSIYVVSLKSVLEEMGVDYQGASVTNAFSIVDTLDNMDNGLFEEDPEADTHIAQLESWMIEHRPSMDFTWIYEEVDSVNWVLFNKYLSALQEQSEAMESYEDEIDAKRYAKDRLGTYLYFEGTVAQSQINSSSTFIPYSEDMIPYETLKGMTPAQHAKEYCAFLMMTVNETEEFYGFMREYSEVFEDPIKRAQFATEATKYIDSTISEGETP